MPSSENLEPTLSAPYLWFASAQSFNDPFETEGAFTYPEYSLNDKSRYVSLAMCHEIFMSQGDLGAIKPFPPNLEPRELHEILVDHYRKLAGGFMKDAYLKKIGVCCLVSDTSGNELAPCCKQVQEDNPYLNRLMWSHYANGLSGICLEFDALALYQSLHSLNPLNAIHYSAICYSEERPLIDMFDFMEQTYLKSSSKGGGLAMSLVETKNTKSSVWAYENEFRFKALNAVNAKLSYSPKAIKAAYFGQRLTHDDKAKYKRILNELGVTNLREVVLEPHSFKLKAIPLVI
jgi:hypothetical protein